MQHTLVALVEDKPGVLNRVSSLFRRRAFNIESLTVGHTAEPGISRMTIVVDSDDLSVERLTAYLYKLVNVIQVHDLTEQPAVSRDLAMIKVNATPETRTHIMQTVDVFRARIVDVTNNSFIIEVTGDEAKIEGLVEVLKPLGIIEMVRTGVVAMARGSSPITYTNGNGNNNGHYTPAMAD
ncbi:MAG: acetolactate synthase small subunit [Chloroflexi bacterium RBG_16_57_11]|nr:MAG: acetolactate synthase small subunit [Chloroflexi bacterium RBG_16_57_11]